MRRWNNRDIQARGLIMVVCALVTSGVLAGGATAGQTGRVALPKVVGPVAGTPFNGNATEFTPLDLKQLGYGEQEYFISGRSNVYGWTPNGHYKTKVLRSGDYTTRIVVHMPTDRKKWNGTAVVEIVNMTGFDGRHGFDYPGVWANNWREITAKGMAYVGITSKPNVFGALKNFDAKRYARMSMANPLPAAKQTCGSLPGDKDYDPNFSKLYENGLIYDAFTQLGALLRSRSASNPLGRGAKHVYLTGLSQSAGILRNYVRFMAAGAKLADGHPVFDGYRDEGPLSGEKFLALVTINQCAKTLPAGDPQIKLPDVGVPIIEVHAGADFSLDLPRQSDSSYYRRWEIAGSFHDNTWTFEHGFANDTVFQKQLPDLGVVVSRDLIPHCASSYPPDPPYQDVYDSSLAALDAWVEDGRSAPHVPSIDLEDGQAKLDALGNQVGGLRLPAVDVPVATYHPELFEPVADCSHKVRLSDAQLQQLYPTHDVYVSKVKASVAGLVARRLLTPADAAEEVRAAASSDVP